MNASQPSESAIQAHLGMLQNVVQRMASNSASCKTWCITIVSAIIVAVADKPNEKLLWIAAIPIPAFLLLDAYYLGLERGFRDSYNAFVSRYCSGTLRSQDVFCISPSKDVNWLRLEAFTSFSILGFYLPLAAIVAVVKAIIT
ncbi:hypothetical protein [Denitratimonas tolerans]|jgi:hypothetical protein|uniref:Uncharacterized protein n=1 Tax=Denitratimonas tolerans TaxID=1338420 RepID=A0AAW9R9E2_9GAMM